MTQPYDVEYASPQFQEWLSSLKDRAMLATHNQSQAMFRAVLQRLRRYLTTEQTLTFADALPPLPRGIFLEGWRPADPLPLTSAQDLIKDVADHLSAHHAPPDSVVADVFAVLAERSEPRIAKIMREQLPDQLKPLWP